MEESDFIFDASRTIALDTISISKILEICNNVLPKTHHGYPCKYTLEYKDIICKYDLHNNYGSGGSGIHWIEFSLRHLRYALKLNDVELSKLLDCIYLHRSNESSLHAITYLYDIYKERKRTDKIDSIVE